MLHSFLDFELDEARRELRWQGRPVPTQTRVFDLIVHLLRARERVVRREELMDALWPRQVVSDAAVSQVIMQARKALGDEGESQRVIKTLRGRGLRFVAEVESRAPALEAPVAIPTPVRMPSAEPPDAAPRAPLLGRSSELRALLGRLGRAELGQGSLVLIEGEPGVGKTTLAEQLAECAAERGFEVIWGRAWEGGGAPPFWPWIQVLRAVAQREGAERLQSWLGSGELSPLLPEFGAVSALAFGARPEARAPTAARLETLNEELGGARARFRQFDVLSRLLHHLCGRGADKLGERRPFLVLLDDLHAADDASVQLVRFLMPDLRELGLLLVGTYRGLECKDREALSSLAELCAADTLHLRGLLPDDVAELLGRKLGKPAPRRLASALHNLSAGNPLLLAELCSRLEDDQTEPQPELLQLADFALPERIVGAVRKHLQVLPEPTRAALSAASALGREFSQPLLAGLLGGSEAELIARLGPALARGVLRATGAPGRWQFSHVLVCNAVYAELPAEARLSLHRRIAEQLEGSAPPERLPLHELAHHYYLAAADGVRAKALDYAERAAQQASAVTAHQAAAELYDRAVALAELEQVPSARLHGLLCNAALAWYRSGDLERVAVRYDRAAALAEAELERGAPEARQGAAERYAEAIMLCSCAQRGAMLHDPARLALPRRALLLLPPGDGALRARLLSISTLGLRSPETLAERRATTLAAVEMARRLGDPEVLLWTLNARHYVLWGAAPPEEMVQIAHEMVELARRTQNSEVLLDALLWTGADYAEMGDAAAMLRARDEFGAAAERYNSPWHRYMALGSDTLQASGFSALAQARELSSRMLAFGHKVQESLADTFYALRTMFFDVRQGTLARASDPREAVEVPACVAPDYRAFWALAWAHSGYTSAARRLLFDTLSHERELLDALRAPLLAALAEVCCLLDERDAAAEVYRLLRPSAGRHLLIPACIYMGPVDHYLGLLAQQLGQADEADAYFERALRSCISPNHRAEIQHAYGRSLLSRDAARAQALIAGATEHAERFGLDRLAARAGGAQPLLELGAGAAPASAPEAPA